MSTALNRARRKIMQRSSDPPDVTCFAAIAVLAAITPVVYAIATHNPIPIIGGAAGLIILAFTVSVDEMMRIKSLPPGLWIEPLTLLQLLYFAAGGWIAWAGFMAYKLAAMVL
jgi:hypothetical protein